jgi:DNA-binding NarL/FixJ family response regulator
MFRILIVENNPHFRGILRGMLSERFPDVAISEAADGMEALRDVKDPPPDLVFMDIELPGENGLIITRKIKTAHPEVMVAVLTQYDLPEYEEAAFSSGASYFLPKESTAAEDILSLVESIYLQRNP